LAGQSGRTFSQWADDTSPHLLSLFVSLSSLLSSPLVTEKLPLVLHSPLCSEPPFGGALPDLTAPIPPREHPAVRGKRIDQQKARRVLRRYVKDRSSGRCNPEINVDNRDKFLIMRRSSRRDKSSTTHQFTNI
jgi:hypothetical protein